LFDIDILATPSLGNRSYLASDGQVAIAVDPPRDVDRVLALAGRRGVRLALVVETHGHNDMVSGGLELHRLTGAPYATPAGDDAGFDRVPVTDGQTLAAGSMRLTVLHTPGHTHSHVAYALQDADGGTQAVFTGGSLLFGATGRTDLVGPEHTDDLTRAQFHSVRRLVAELPAEAAVYPTHGFGSFCAATPTSGDASTLGEQRQVNPALTLDEQAYVDALLAGLDAYPAYYRHMAPVNRRGPAPVDLSAPAAVDAAELRRRIDAGEWVVDLRGRAAFAAGHLPGSLGFELSTSFVTYLGWTIPWDTPLTLVGESEEQVAEAQRELVRIGIDRLAGAATGDLAQLSDRPLRSYDVVDFAGLAEAQRRGPVHVLDTRRHDERRVAALPGSQHIPLHELPARLAELPETTVYVHCGSGYRASVAASMLDALGQQVVLVDDSFDNARAAGLTGPRAAA
jgi:glyoxylase-like metal-dependent hydrolase (beta-lactamase superfamily II)/rhodanese-related sulfurtransferase